VPGTRQKQKIRGYPAPESFLWRDPSQALFCCGALHKKIAGGA